MPTCLAPNFVQLKSLFGIDTSDAVIEPDDIAAAQQEGETREDYALRHGEKYGLTLRSDWGGWK